MSFIKLLLNSKNVFGAKKLITALSSPEWELKREKNSYEGTFGKLYHNGKYFADTIELPWRNNRPYFSCIPTGTYQCKWTWSPAFKREMYILLEVSGRSGIRIHKGSYAGATDRGFRTDFLGCISFGRGKVYDGNNKQHILHTTAATIAKFESLLEKKDFELTISGDFDSLD